MNKIALDNFETANMSDLSEVQGGGMTDWLNNFIAQFFTPSSSSFGGGGGGGSFGGR